MKKMGFKVGDLLNSGLEAVLGKAETGIGSRIAIIDSGIFLSHDSFKDKGIPRPPGSRYYDPDRVNNKVIKNKEYMDVEVRNKAHGTVAASVAAGNFVEGANVNGLAKRTYRGADPSAHLLIYDVIDIIKDEADSTFTYEADSLATYKAMLDAIDDGVDVISISLGAAWDGFDKNPIAQGACRAAIKNVLVVCSGGNNGPDRNTVVNCKFPWSICVGATHTHTRFDARVKLGNNTTLYGEAVYTRSENASLDEQIPLVLFESVDAMMKAPKGQLLGKLVALYRSDTTEITVSASDTARDCGAYGLIIINNELLGYSITLKYHDLPTLNLPYKDFEKLRAYVNSTEEPTGKLVFLPADELNPMGGAVAGLSSRGPNGKLAPKYIPTGVIDDDLEPIPTFGVLKPDVVATGANVMGACHLDPTRFVIKSGTSFSCPHVAGLAAILAREFPGWTRLEIKGALLTTADFLDTSGHPIMDENRLRARLWDIGCGLVNLDKARDPGLLYPVDVEREIPAYLRGFGHTNDQISKWVGFEVTGDEIMTAPQLNYPSFRIQFTKSATTKYTGKTQKYTRKVRNVGGPGLRNRVDQSTVVPNGVAITVTPPVLEFSDDESQVLDYDVVFELKSQEFPTEGASEGFITWISDEGHLVRSPILAELLD